MGKNNNFLSSNGGILGNLKISKNLKLWLIVPIAILVAAIIVVAIVGGLNQSVSEGFNIGIDFEGGTILSVKFGEESLPGNENYQTHANAVTQKIESYGVKVSYVQASEAGVKENSTITFRYKNISNNDADISKLNTDIQQGIKELYPTRAVDEGFIKAESIGKTASSELITRAILALTISTLLILVYIIFRFELVSGISAVITMIHDVIIMFALTLIFRIQINSSFVAATITIISYAINNTIIVFDRCREIIKPFKGNRGIVYEDIGDEAVKNTLNRTIFTTFTTLITVLFLAILGGASLREFTIPIILGLVAGLYSSIFLATPIWSNLSYVAERIREQRLDRKKAVYETIDDEGNLVQKEEIVEKTKEKKPQAKKVYKYTKKNTTFKKK